MTEIRLSRVELKEILKAMNDICGNETEFTSVLISCNPGSIGSTVFATFDLKHNGYEGEYTIPITDEGSW